MSGDAILAAVIGAIAAVAASWLLIRHSNFERELANERWKGSIERQVDMIWQFLTRKGVNEALITGLVERGSPLHVNVARLDKHQDFIQKVKDWYDKGGCNLDDIKLFVELEKQFHIEIQKMCEIEGLLTGGVIAAILFIIRPNAQMFKQYDTSDWHDPLPPDSNSTK
jgi:hypothetical protein